MQFGLVPEYFEELISIFKKFPDLEKVILYGSRARGDYKKWSDIDLAVIGDTKNLEKVTDLRFELEDSDLPYFCDVVEIDKIYDEKFLENILKDGVVIYEKK